MDRLVRHDSPLLAEFNKNILPKAEKLFASKIRAEAGSRQIPEETLRELSVYWTACLVRKINSSTEKKLNDLLRVVDDNLEGELLCEEQRWKRGIESYMKFSGLRLLPAIEKAIDEKGLCRLADIGCGDAFALGELKEKYGDRILCQGLSAFDHSTTNDVPVHIGIAEILPENWANNFDVVTCFEASMYFLDQRRAFEEALRILAPSGQLFYGTNNCKGGMDSEYFESKLHLSDYKYVVPDGRPRTGEIYTGANGFEIGRFLDFMDFVREIANKKSYRLDDKKFAIDIQDIPLAWCTETLRAVRKK